MSLRYRSGSWVRMQALFSFGYWDIYLVFAWKSGYGRSGQMTNRKVDRVVNAFSRKGRLIFMWFAFGSWVVCPLKCPADFAIGPEGAGINFLVKHKFRYENLDKSSV